MSLNLNNYIKLLSLCILLTISQGAWAQFPKSIGTWSGSHANPTSIAQADDSGYLLCGQAFNSGTAELYKLNVNGELLWSRIFNQNENILPVGFIQARDGGYWVYGGTSVYKPYLDAFICKLDPCGNPVKGYVFKDTGYCYIDGLFELHDNRLLLNLGNTEYRINSIESSAIALFDFSTGKWLETKKIPLGPNPFHIPQKTGLQYLSSSFYYHNGKDTNLVHLGSSFVCYDSSLNIKHLKPLSPFSFNDTPEFTIQAGTNTILAPNGNILTAGIIRGLNRSGNSSPSAVIKLNNKLDYLEYIDLGNDLPLYWLEEPKFIHQTAEDSLVVLNLIIKNTMGRSYQAQFISLDSNLKVRDKKYYADTANTSYFTYSSTKTYDNKIMVLMEEFKRGSSFKYHLVKLNSDLSLDTNKHPDKAYDFKCGSTPTYFDEIDIYSFDTLKYPSAIQTYYFTGISDWRLNSKDQIKVYPNPSQGMLHFSGLSDTENLISVYNMKGQEVYRAKCSNSDTVLDLETLPPGMYVLSCTNKNGGYSQLIVLE